MLALAQQQWGKSVSQKTIQRIVKALALTWRRIRHRPAGTPDAAVYARKQQTLKHLSAQHQAGIIDLRYLDESGFCLTPYLPYAWQEKGATIALPMSKGKRLNVLGLLNTDNQLAVYTFFGAINSEVVIACIDDFARSLTQKTVVVVDNAKIHASEALVAQIPKWKALGLEIFYLPVYSPQLNLIEILWRFIKYHWLPFSAYLSFSHLVSSVEDILKRFGTEYQINFV